MIHTAAVCRKLLGGCSTHLSIAIPQSLKVQKPCFNTVCISDSSSKIDWKLSFVKAIPRTRSYTLQIFGIVRSILAMFWHGGLSSLPRRLRLYARLHYNHHPPVKRLVHHLLTTSLASLQPSYRPLEVERSLFNV